MFSGVNKIDLRKIEVRSSYYSPLKGNEVRTLSAVSRTDSRSLIIESNAVLTSVWLQYPIRVWVLGATVRYHRERWLCPPLEHRAGDPCTGPSSSCRTPEQPPSSSIHPSIYSEKKKENIKWSLQYHNIIFHPFNPSLIWK